MWGRGIESWRAGGGSEQEIVVPFVRREEEEEEEEVRERGVRSGGLGVETGGAEERGIGVSSILITVLKQCVLVGAAMPSLSLQ